MSRVASDWAGNIAAFVIVIIVNGMANGVPIGGQTTGEISDKYPSLFTPAGFTFSIWGLIYLSLAAFVVWQALPSQRNNEALAKTSLPFKINCLANAVWIFAWHYDQMLISLVLMVGILVTLIRIFRDLDGKTSLVVKIPFSIYTGWITVATIANISAAQSAWDLNDTGLGAIEWTLIKLAVAGTIGAVVISRTKNIFYILVIAWAALGIYSKQGETPEVAGAAITLSLLAALLALYTLLFDRTGQV